MEVRDRRENPEWFVKKERKRISSKHKKLTWDKVNEIRRAASTGMSGRMIASKLKISSETVAGILRGTTWNERDLFVFDICEAFKCSMEGQVDCSRRFWGETCVLHAEHQMLNQGTKNEVKPRMYTKGHERVNG